MQQRFHLRTLCQFPIQADKEGLGEGFHPMRAPEVIDNLVSRTVFQPPDRQPQLLHG